MREEQGQRRGRLRDPEEFHRDVVEGEGREGLREGPGEVDEDAEAVGALRGSRGGGERGLDGGEPAVVPVLRRDDVLPIHGDEATLRDGFLRIESQVPRASDEIADPRLGPQDDRDVAVPEALEDELRGDLVLLLRGRDQEQHGARLRDRLGDELVEPVDAEAAHPMPPGGASAAISLLTIPRPPRRAPVRIRFANRAARARGAVVPSNPPGPRTLLSDEDA